MELKTLALAYFGAGVVYALSVTPRINKMLKAIRTGKVETADKDDSDFVKDIRKDLSEFESTSGSRFAWGCYALFATVVTIVPILIWPLLLVSDTLSAVRGRK